MITVGPTGKVVKGDVLDVSQIALEQMLRDYDANLYFSWNPTKLHGHGVWELRRRPDLKTALHEGSYQGMNFYTVDYLESDLNHVKDFAYLNYNIVEWVKLHDIWGQFNFDKDKEQRLHKYLKDMDNAQESLLERKKKAMRKELTYDLMQDRSAISDLKNRVLSGVNPNLLGKFWK